MRKNNNNIKRLKFAKISICFALVQIILVLLFLHCFHDLIPIQEDQTEQITIEVVNTGYWETPFRKHQFTIYTNTDSYVFSNPGILGDYSNFDLYESIQPGDVIYLCYVKSFDIFGNEKKQVVAAQTASQVYRTIEEENSLSRKAILPTIIMIALLEGLFLAVLMLFVVLNKNLFRQKRKNTGDASPSQKRK